MTTPPKTDTERYLESLLYPPYEPQATAAPTPSDTPRRDKLRASLTPLHERLRAALAKFSDDVVADGLHMDVVWPLVTGRQREKPRAFEVAAALRVLGWQRYRIYSDGTAPSGTYWFPPDIDPAEAKAAVRRRKA